VLESTPLIAFGAKPPFIRLKLWTPLDGYDDNVLQAQTGSATAIGDGAMQTGYWHTVAHVIFTIPYMERHARAQFDNFLRDWGLKLRMFRFYPDYQSDSFFHAIFAETWIPRYQIVVPGRVFALACDLRRLDQGQMDR